MKKLIIVICVIFLSTVLIPLLSMIDSEKSTQEVTQIDNQTQTSQTTTTPTNKSELVTIFNAPVS